MPIYSHRSIYLLLLGLSLFAGDAFAVRKRIRPQLTPPFDSVYEKGRSQTVRIWHDGSICAGVVVTRRLVLTSWHCVAELRSLQVSFDDKSKLRADRNAEVLVKDRSTDLAVLRLSQDFDLPPATLASTPAKSGDQVLVIGHPYGDLYYAAQGTVVEPDERFFLTSAAVEPGNSGGPAFNAKGELIGNVSRRNNLFGGRYLGDCAALKPMQDIIARAEKDPPPLRFYSAEGHSFLTFGALWDPYMDKLSGRSSTHLTYRIGFDMMDRLRVAWRHSILRPERVRAVELSWVFKFGQPAGKQLEISPGWGRNFYSVGGREISADKIFVEVEWGLSFTYQQIIDDGRTWYAVGLEF
jgi:hypothetical protein